MEMKNVVFFIVLLAAMINTIMGHGGQHGVHHTAAPAPAPSHDNYAPAPAPTSDAASLGSLLGSSLLSFVAYYLHFHA
ncbi:hypothetical protein TSUD_363310 [Trifolium subterraneum]|uniref:Uncharacterized protein n=1 Tax=Trifolium subterraneum TaxID=3900 RepID=A0A2Z6NA83_TRISU|nr:hypothetical protein TSUD_363310 [Trifolium subterraneum]